MEWISERLDSIRSTDTRRLLTQLVRFGMIITLVMIAWKALMCFTGSESPVVVVLSGSMEPGFKRVRSSFICCTNSGDILLLHMNKDSFHAGEIIVFNVDGRKISIVHRIIKVHERQDAGKVDILTKGDNNFGDDRPLYAPGQLWLQLPHINGRAIGFLPCLGLVTIIMTEIAAFKYLLIGAMMLLSMMYSE